MGKSFLKVFVLVLVLFAVGSGIFIANRDYESGQMVPGHVQPGTMVVGMGRIFQIVGFR